METARRTAAAGLLLALVLGACLLPPDVNSALIGPTAGVVGVAALMLTWPKGRHRVAAASAAVASTSLLVTIFVAVIGPVPPQPNSVTALWVVLELGTLAVYVYLPVRWTTPLRSGWPAGLAALAAASLVLRFELPRSLLFVMAVCSTWAVPAVTAGLAAAYLRTLDAARGRAVRDARQQQRIELAGDLHDFVAHDVSGIVALAQAGATVLADRDPIALQVMRRIEEAGQRSLASMDRAIDMLHEESRAPVGVLADLPGLMHRHKVDTLAAITELDLDPATTDVPREVSSLAYRVVVESLTNVTRHATFAQRVTVAARCEEGDLHVSVTDDGGGRKKSDRHHGGRGLLNLTMRVEALGGNLQAGPLHGTGWRVAVTLPTAPATSTAP